jgi:hypothetical protein
MTGGGEGDIFYLRLVANCNTTILHLPLLEFYYSLAPNSVSIVDWYPTHSRLVHKEEAAVELHKEEAASNC